MPTINEIKSSLKSIREKLGDLMKVNMERDDLSKLKESEFYLDLEELDHLNREADQEILSKVQSRFEVNIPELPDEIDMSTYTAA